MAKKKLEVSLSPIVAQIDKVEKRLKALKPRVSPADRKKIDVEVRDLNKIRTLIGKACHAKMTHAFVPADKEE